MKKSLIAIAVLGAAAFSAQAANVTLYGTVDGGFMYKNAKVTVAGQQVGEKESSFKSADGVDGANKIGIKGEEDIGNAKVGFKLENDFKLSNGNLGDKNKLFQREARLYVHNQFGELAAGRFGGLASAAGTYNIFFNNADAFDGGDNEINTGFVQSKRYDNSIAYQSPEIAGIQGTLMYSFQEKGEQKDKMKNNDRYIGAGLTFKQDALTLVGVFEGQIRNKADKDDDIKNAFTYNLGGNYDFGMAKVFGGFQYAHNVRFDEIKHYFDAANTAKEFGGAGAQKLVDQRIAAFNKTYTDLNDAGKPTADVEAEAADYLRNLNKLGNLDGADVLEADIKTVKKVGINAADAKHTIENSLGKVVTAGAGLLNKSAFNGYAFTLGSQIPFGANKVTVAGYYGNYKNAKAVGYTYEDSGDNKYAELFGKKDIKLQVYGLDARYEYSLSKRTTLAAGAGIGQSKIKFAGENAKSKVAQVYAGLHHNF